MKKNIFTIICSLLIITTHAGAQVSADYAVQLTATVIENPPSITLHWNQYTGATSYVVYRKAAESSSWGASIANLSGDSLEYKDSNVQLDSLYEYSVNRSGNFISAKGYLTGAIRLHSKDYKGWLLLVVNSSIGDSLQTELHRLMKDISNEGWGVERIDVSPDDSVPVVKALIAAEYNSNPDLKSVLLFGHIPVPYSGELNPDGHPDHLGAWPADGYYAEMDADWTDDYVDNAMASRPENWNTIGDGKFDDTYLPDDVDLQIGRVDLHNLPSFPATEIQLLQQYLNKDHDYRVGNFTAQSRGLIDDNFGAFNGEAFASCGFRNFAPLLGNSSVDETDYFTTLSQNSYLWSYGCGGGWYQGAGGVGSTAEFVNDSVKTVFTMLFGSYFGDWDNQDNFLRAPLASKGYALTSCWAGRPFWFFHYMALGENIGYCTRLTQNNYSTYPGNYGTYRVHVALMGDPTLRMYVIRPPSGVVLLNPAGDPSSVEVSWSNSIDDVDGYYIYRSISEFGKYDRISDTLVMAAPFVDHPPATGTYYYMVRAVRLEDTPSGSFYNLGGGDGDSISAIVSGIATENVLFRDFSIYPNPVSGQLIVLFNNSSSHEVIITDVTGKVAQKENFPPSYSYAVMDVSSLAPGMYLISLGKEVKKLVKQ